MEQINFSFIILSFSSLFALINPIGISPILLSMTEDHSDVEYKIIIKKGIITAYIILTLFTLMGDLIFKFYGITIYAFMIAGFLDLYEYSHNAKWLRAALSFQSVLDRDFSDKVGGYFFVAKANDTLLARDKPDYDGAIPAGNSVAVLNLARLSLLTGDLHYDSLARKTLTAFGQTLLRSGRAMPKMLTGLDFILDQALQIIVVRPTSETQSESITKAIHETFLPNRVVLSVTDADVNNLSKTISLLEGKKSVNSKPTVYVCRGTSCSLPLTDVGSLKRELAMVTPYNL